MSTPKRAIIFDGQNMSTADLNFSEEKRVEEDDLRFKEIANTYGILHDVLDSLALSNPAPYTGNVAAGVAYDDLGRTIRVVTGDTNPLRAAPLEFTFAGGDVGKLITLAYATEQTTPFAHPVTGTPGFTRLDYNPTVQLRVTAAEHEVIIGTIESIDGSGNATFNTDDAQYWGALLAPQTEQNILDALSGMRRHHQLDHVSGIERVSIGGNPGAITINGTPTPDEADVQNTAARDSLLIGDHRIEGASQFTNTNLKFAPSQPEITDEPQLWAIWVNRDGVVGKTLAAQYQAAQVIEGMEIVDISPFGTPFPDPLIIEHYKSGATHYLRLVGDSGVTISSNGTYLLRSDADPDLAVLVNVTVADLPSGGTDGSPLQDEIVMSDIFDVDGAPNTVLDDDSNPALLLGFVWWYGTILNLLGYGTWGATGVAYDKRNYGNLDDSQISDAFKSRLLRLLTETRANGFVVQPSVTFSDATLNVHFAPGAQPYAYIDGERLRIPPGGYTFAMGASTSRVVYLLNNNNGTASWGNQSGSGSIGVPLSAGKMPVYNLTSDGAGITDSLDLRVVLPNIDVAVARLSGRHNSGELDVDHLQADDIRLGRRLLADADSALDSRFRVELPPIATVARSSVMAAFIKTLPINPADPPPYGLGWTIYAVNGLDSVVSYELVFNAYRSDADVLWHRRTTGVEASIWVLNYDGTLRWYRREAGSADTWTGAFDDAGGWETRLLYVSPATGLNALGEARISFKSLSSGLTTLKARKCSVTRDTGADTFTIAFNPDMPDDDYVVSINAYQIGGAMQGYTAVDLVKTAATLVFSLKDYTNGIINIDGSASGPYVDVFVSGA